MREELERVCRQGFAVDDQEIAPDLRCVAVPLRNAEGQVLAAISVSQDLPSRRTLEDGRLIAMLRDAARKIETDAFRGEWEVQAS
jgi:DNA-binding IclR family transcriptional regulator